MKITVIVEVSEATAWSAAVTKQACAIVPGDHVKDAVDFLVSCTNTMLYDCTTEYSNKERENE
jgi:hypothetical protein